MVMMNISVNIPEELGALNEDWIVMLESPSELSSSVSQESIEFLINEQSYIGIILTATKPYKTLKKQFDEKGIDSSKIIFIDCVSKSQSSEIEQDGNVIYIDAAYNLTNISLAFKKIIDRIDGKKFLYVDSLSAMLIHNTPEIFVRFIHGLITSMRLASISGLLLSLTQQTDSKVRTEVANLCDKVIVVS